jgi:hypothetical protein
VFRHGSITGPPHEVRRETDRCSVAMAEAQIISLASVDWCVHAGQLGGGDDDQRHCACLLGCLPTRFLQLGCMRSGWLDLDWLVAVVVSGDGVGVDGWLQDARTTAT